MGGVPPLATTSATTREYIHSPGYVDEVVGQVDVPLSPTAADRPAWVIQDANYNIVALINDNGDLLHQYTWDPYGQPIAIDRYDTGAAGTAMAPFENRLGHQGLFFDRFDGGVQNVLLPQLWVEAGTGLSAKGLYQNRNRSYNPGLGRFVQRDPNATGTSVLGFIASKGQSIRPSIGPADLGSLYGDGANLFALGSSSPVTGCDPTGLEWEENYDGVLLRLVGIADSAMPVSMLGPLGSLLDGYHKLKFLKDLVNQEIQQPAFDQEERVDWAMDWSREDTVPYEEMGQFGPGAFESDVNPLGIVANPWKSRQRSGKRGERQALEETGFVKAKRYTKTTNPRTGQTRVRLHDNEHPTVPGQFMEVKTGHQGVTERTLRQIRKDALMIHREGKEIRWRFYYRKSPNEISPDLLTTLKNYGIPFDPPMRLQ